MLIVYLTSLIKSNNVFGVALFFHDLRRSLIFLIEAYFAVWISVDLEKRHRGDSRQKNQKIFMPMKQAFGDFFKSKPAQILDQKYDSLVIWLLGMTWVFFAYSPYIVTALARPEKIQISNTLLLLWVPSTFLSAFYFLYPEILRLDRIGKIFLFISLGVVTLLLHFFIKGFGIIDFSWFIFYYGNIGLIMLLRNMQRRMLELKSKVESDFDKYDRTVILELKNEWLFFLSKFVQAYLAVAAILGVCMTILLSGQDVVIAGNKVAAWKDWDRMQHAARMAFLFLIESALYFVFFLAPLLDVLGSYQALLVKKYETNKIQPLPPKGRSFE